MRVVFHNLRVNRRRQLVGGEVRALVRATLPDVVAVCEAWQYPAELARVPGYRYLSRRGTTPGERDAGLLVAHGVHVRRFGLVRTRTSWPRTKGPGQHWPRTFPWADLEHEGTRVRVVVVHWPRDLPANQLAVAECWARLLLLALRAPSRRLLLIGDYNQSAKRRGLWTPRTLARAIGARMHGRGILLALARRLRVRDTRVLEDQQRGSDHPPLLLELG